MSERRTALENYASEIEKEWRAYSVNMPFDVFFGLRIQRLNDKKGENKNDTN